MLSKWKGPFKIVRQIGKVNYKVEITEPVDRIKIFHINMLKRWYGPELGEHMVNHVMDEPEEILCYKRQQQEISDATFGEDIREEERDQMKDLIRKYRTLISRTPEEPA